MGEQAGEVIQALWDAAEAAPEDEKAKVGETWIKNGGPHLTEILENTSLIDAQYLIALHEAGGTPTRWQDLPDAAKITKDNVWRLACWGVTFSLPVLIFSYCWLSPDHPDPVGEQLGKVVPILKVLLEQAKQFGEHATIGVMQDYMSYPQMPRTAEEERRFEAGLHNELNLWYSHPYTIVLMIDTEASDVPEHTNRRPYIARGWCSAEMHLSSVVKDGTCLLSMSKFDPNASYNFDSLRNALSANRLSPRSPPAFAEELRTGLASGELAFTHNSDSEIVIKIYEKGFVRSFDDYITIRDGNPNIHYTIIGWEDEVIPSVIDAFTYADKHTSCEYVMRLIIGIGNNFSEDGAKALEEAFGSLPHFDVDTDKK